MRLERSASCEGLGVRNKKVYDSILQDEFARISTRFTERKRKTGVAMFLPKRLLRTNSAEKTRKFSYDKARAASSDNFISELPEIDMCLSDTCVFNESSDDGGEGGEVERKTSVENRWQTLRRKISQVCCLSGVQIYNTSTFSPSTQEFFSCGNCRILL